MLYSVKQCQNSCLKTDLVMILLIRDVVLRDGHRHQLCYSDYSYCVIIHIEDVVLLIVPFRFQHEVKVKTIVESMKDTSAKKSSLQEELDCVTEELAQLKAKEKLYTSQIAEKHKEHSDNMASAEEIRTALESQMTSVNDQHHKQLSTLRNEIDEKQAKIDELTG